jgi:hypothetical protein
MGCMRAGGPLDPQIVHVIPTDCRGVELWVVQMRVWSCPVSTRSVPLKILGNRNQCLIMKVDCADSRTIRYPAERTTPLVPQKTIGMRLSALIVRQDQVGSSLSKDGQTELGAVSMNGDDSSPVLMSRK